MNTTLTPNGEFVKINNHNMHIYRQGNETGPKIVFLSGSGTVAPVYDFKILYNKLLPDFRIIVIEKFGYGYSDLFEAPCDINSVVSMQREALKVLGEEGPYILASHSMGGLEAIRWKQLYPEEVCGLIGLDMATPVTYKSWNEEEVAKRLKVMKLAKKLKIHKLLNTSAGNSCRFTSDEKRQQKLLRNRNSFNDCYINEANAVLKNADIVDDAGNIECPTLLFTSNGKQTSKNWVEHQEKFADEMKAKLVRFDCGHYIHYFESEKICKEITAFVKEIL